MPQLDSVTFLSQYVWTMVVFVGYFLLLVKYILPRLGRARLLRRAKTEMTSPASMRSQTRDMLPMALHRATTTLGMPPRTSVSPGAWTSAYATALVKDHTGHMVGRFHASAPWPAGLAMQGVLERLKMEQAV
jgi:hypothetical protein